MTLIERATQQKQEALELLQNKPKTSAFVERWLLLDEACARFEGEPQPQILGKGLHYILQRASLPVRSYDILLGRYDDHVPTDAEAAAILDVWNRRVYSSQNPITHPNTGHLTLDWEELVRLGLVGYVAKTEQKIEEVKATSADGQDLLFLDGMHKVYTAILNYIARYAEAAEATGLSDCAAVCRNLCIRAPETFREAMQLILFVFTVYMIYAGWHVACLTLGRMDNYLLPYYLADINSGRMTEEEAGAIIDDFNCKANLHLGRGEHQMGQGAPTGINTGWKRNHTYDSPTYIVIGGYSETSNHRENPLTKLFVKHITLGFKNPVYIYRWNRERPDDVWCRISDLVRNNASILLYNDETMIPAMEHIGVEHTDAINYTVHPCNWPDIAGGYAIADKIGEPMPEMLMAALSDGEGRFVELSSTEELYSRYADYYREKVRAHFAKFRRKYRSDAIEKRGVLSLNDCFTHGPLDQVRALTDGGAKYLAVYTFLRNVATAADMVAAIDRLVFTERKCTLQELSDALQCNFEGYGALYALCKKTAKFGTDDAFADGHAVRLVNTMLDILDEESINEKGERDVLSLNVTITDMDHIRNGAAMGATPDGRLMGEPLSENLSASVGYNESVTALLNSVSKLPFDRIHSGVLNLRLRKETIAGDAGLLRMQALMDTYFEQGGIQLQISIADTALLRAAQCCPNQYRDLMVRVTGYSTLFTDMSVNGQEEIIRRDEML
ncbi:MAG: hypothetical protein IJF33_06930 [Clostridia bacterium]|nr:hypothetical protein [Clostridia bacterium]